jgi:hypothetical protein
MSFWFYAQTKLLPCSEIDSCFLITAESCAWFLLAMVIAIALFSGARCPNICGKLRRISMHLVFKFHEFSFRILVKLQNCQFPSIWPPQKSSSVCQTLWGISPESLIVWWHVQTRWKEEEVLYIFAIQPLVRTQPQQYRFHIFWLLLMVKSDLTLAPCHLPRCFRSLRLCLFYHCGWRVSLEILSVGIRGSSMWLSRSTAWMRIFCLPSVSYMPSV